MALRRQLLGGANHITALLKPKIRYWAPLNHNALIPTCSSPSSTLLLLQGFSASSSSSSNPNSGSLLLCGGTCIYKGAHKDDWIIKLAQFAVQQYNLKERKHLRYVRVVGASHTSASSMLYHITLEAVSVNRTKMYHVIVWMQIFKNFMELLVWMPVSDTLWTLGVKYGDLRLHEAVMLYMNQAKQDRFLT